MGKFKSLSISLILFLSLFTNPTVHSQYKPISNSKKSCIDLLRHFLAPSLEDSLKFIKSRYKLIEKNRYWNKWIDDETDFLRFVRMETYNKKSKVIHGSEIYGVDNFLAFKNAAEYLNSIPVGKLDLSIDLFKKVHKMGSESISPILKKLSPAIPDGWLPSQGGLLKKRFSIGRDPLFSPLNEKQYQAIMNNKWLHQKRFLELPYPLSKPGKRRGMIFYGDPKNVEESLNELISWYDTNKDTMNPILLAAKFQQAFVSIHPFIDGNGRASRLLMDRILAEYKLPPPLMRNTSEDIYMNSDEWANEIAEGLQRFITMSSNKGSIPPPWIGNEGIILLFYKMNLNKLLKNAHVSQKVPIPFFSYEIHIGDMRFVLFKDGFLYNNKGIPHALHDNKLYPIADRSYILYEMVGKINNNDSTGIKFSKSHRDVYRKHFDFIKGVRNGTIDQGAVEIIPYDSIKVANENGIIYLHTWQKNVFEEIIAINDKDPIKVLNRSARRVTVFERKYNFGTLGSNISPFEVIAQYQKMDLQFYKYYQYALQNSPELVETVMESRRKIHMAAKQLLVPLFKSFEDLGPKAHTLIENDIRFKSLTKYYQNSPLFFDTLDDAIKQNGDDSITLLRASNKSASVLGFRDQKSYARFYRTLPGNKKITVMIRKLTDVLSKYKDKTRLSEMLLRSSSSQERYKKILSLLPEGLRKYIQKLDGQFLLINKLVHNISDNILTSALTYKGSLPEFQREYVELLLHAKGYASQKEGISFTSSLGLLLEVGSPVGIPYTTTKNGGRVFFVKVSKKKVEFNYTSAFSFEYEFVSKQTVHPWRIFHTLSWKEMKTQDLTEIDKKTKVEFDNFIEKWLWN